MWCVTPTTASNSNPCSLKPWPIPKSRPEHVPVRAPVMKNIRQVIVRGKNSLGTEALCPPAARCERAGRGQARPSRWGRSQRKSQAAGTFKARLQTPTGRSRCARARLHHRRAPPLASSKVPAGFIRFPVARDSIKVKNEWNLVSMAFSTAAAWLELGCEKHHDRPVILFFLQECIHLTAKFSSPPRLSPPITNGSPTGLPQTVARGGGPGDQLASSPLVAPGVALWSKRKTCPGSIVSKSQ